MTAKTDINESPKNEIESGLISRRAEIFRSKMIHDFNLLQTLGEGGGVGSPSLPILSTRDIMDGKKSQAATAEEASLVQFQDYSNKVCKCIGVVSDRWSGAFVCRYTAADFCVHECN